jgi:hypothetical protein
VAIRTRAVALVLIALAITTSTAAGRGRHNSRCLVPDVKGDTLTKAERMLQAADCSTGRVSGPRGASRVGAQIPRRGARERPGARVALILKRRITTPVPHTPGATGTAGSAALAPVGIPGNWKLVLDSEFNGPSLNTSIWHYGWSGNGMSVPANGHELDCYSPRNVYFPGDGSVHLDVTASASSCGGVTRPYTGAMITTNPARGRGGFQYTYGVLEARVYLPGDGSLLANWPGVWADGQNWPYDGEDDVMEGIYGMACWSFHNPAGMNHLCYRNLAPGWHTFASDWQPGSITYYYDGINVGTDTSGITSAPMYIILDNTVHVGESFVTQPASMQVQYVRVWQAG